MSYVIDFSHLIYMHTTFLWANHISAIVFITIKINLTVYASLITRQAPWGYGYPIPKSEVEFVGSWNRQCDTGSSQVGSYQSQLFVEWHATEKMLTIL